MNDGNIASLKTGGVLAVGDSFTAGSGVKNHEAWPAQLETIIDTPVINASSGGWGTDQIILRAEQLAPKVLPETIIISLLAQDSLRNSYDLYGVGYKPWFEIKNEELVLNGVPVPQLQDQPVWLGPLRSIFGYSWFVHSTMMKIAPFWWANVSLRYNRVLTNEQGIEVSCKLMERLAKMATDTGIRIVVVMQYGGQESIDETPPWYGKDVSKCTAIAGLEILDTHAPLHQVSKENYDKFVRLWIDEGGQLGHMSSAGNQFIAKLIADRYFSSP